MSFDFNHLYRGTPPWDIGRPQRALVELAEAGELHGAVLDVGCGTGENALYLAARGHAVLGVDSAPLAIARARVKAAEAGSAAEFLVHDVLDLRSLGRRFDTVVDSGLYQVLADPERERFVGELAAVLRSGGSYVLICLSDRLADPDGRRVMSAAEIVGAFGEGWRLNYLRETRWESHAFPRGAEAWLASFTRRGSATEPA